MKLGNWVFAALLLMMSAPAVAAHGTPINFSGDYWDGPGPGELVKVGFAGNRASKSETAAPFILYRVATLARQRHKPYFRLYYTLVDAIRNKPLSETDARRVYAESDGWVFVLFDDTYEIGDLATQEVFERARPIVHPSGATP